MNYYHLKTILSSEKKLFTLSKPTDSFYVAGKQSRAYIEPEFDKVIYEKQKPSIILISAVGATGKSALANTLSEQIGLPLLDLAKHKPVGDNTLTGILTNAYELRDISGILEGLSTGNYGIIIDGIDEGRSKTTEKGFEAFLDDIIKLCGKSERTTIIMLGRTQVLDDCWGYLENRGVGVGLITILPFNIEAAKKYIDEFSNVKESHQYAQYKNTRDFILEMLGSAFSPNTKDKSKNFETFIGYPPVLDAIVTLLTEERNYHKLLEVIQREDSKNVEISLLDRIVLYIIERERQQKVIPNIIDPITAEVDIELQGESRRNAYLREEQSARLVAYCLGEDINFSIIKEPKINEKYESHLISWLPEHPFLLGKKFRNVVFEAASLAALISSKIDYLNTLATRYVSTHKPSYHLAYMTEVAVNKGYIPFSTLNALLSSAMEFRSVHSKVDISIDGGNWHEVEDGMANLVVEIDIQLGSFDKPAKSFEFNSTVSKDDKLIIGPRLAGAFISVPCITEIRASQDFEIIAPVEVEARIIKINTKSLVIRATSSGDEVPDVIFNCGTLECMADNIVVDGADFVISVEDKTGIVYPAVRYIEESAHIPDDSSILQKYFRLRRILLEFRSHSKGSLAKFKDKIEHERVLKNEIGRAILGKMLEDGILYSKGNFYHIDPGRLNQCLGISWQGLRKGLVTSTLSKYLENIEL